MTMKNSDENVQNLGLHTLTYHITGRHIGY